MYYAPHINPALTMVDSVEESTYQGRPRRREQYATQTRALNTAKKTETKPVQPRRPSTRAWEKQQKELKGNAGDNRKLEPVESSPQGARGRRKQQPTSVPAIPSTKPREPPVHRLHPKTRQSTRFRRQSGINPIEPLQVSPHTGAAGERRSRINSKTSATKFTRGRSQKRSSTNQDSLVGKQPGKPQSPRLTGWLNRIESVSPERTARGRALYTAPVPGLLPEDNMNESSSSVNTGDNASTAKEKGNRSTKVTETKLRYRRIQRKATADRNVEHFRSIIRTSLPYLPLKETGGMQDAAQRFINDARTRPDDNSYPFIENFTINFDKAKSEINFAIITERYFNSDLKRCLARNEAVLQRTIMINIIDQYWLGEIFDWNSEGQWSQPDETRLPSTADDTISLPKPDLAIFFTLESFTGEEDSDPVPQDLEKCISPDGGDRCFPFLFMEVKKAGADLQEAYTTNLHSASQALYNIRTWMVRAGKEEQFFNDVRVFSLVFNAQDMSVRVHRAEKSGSGEILFRFDDFIPLERYTKDQACILFKTTVTEYAAKELHPILKEAFRGVTSQESEQVINKRKANLQRIAGSKRTKRQNSLSQTGQSFAMSALSTN